MLLNCQRACKWAAQILAQVWFEHFCTWIGESSLPQYMKTLLVVVFSQNEVHVSNNPCYFGGFLHPRFFFHCSLPLSCPLLKNNLTLQLYSVQLTAENHCDSVHLIIFICLYKWLKPDSPTSNTACELWERSPNVIKTIKYTTNCIKYPISYTTNRLERCPLNRSSSNLFFKSRC